MLLRCLCGLERVVLGDLLRVQRCAWRPSMSSTTTPSVPSCAGFGYTANAFPVLMCSGASSAWRPATSSATTPSVPSCAGQWNTDLECAPGPCGSEVRLPAQVSSGDVECYDLHALRHAGSEVRRASEIDAHLNGGQVPVQKTCEPTCLPQIRWI